MNENIMWSKTINRWFKCTWWIHLYLGFFLLCPKSYCLISVLPFSKLTSEGLRYFLFVNCLHCRKVIRIHVKQESSNFINIIWKSKKKIQPVREKESYHSDNNAKICFLTLSRATCVHVACWKKGGIWLGFFFSTPIKSSLSYWWYRRTKFLKFINV